MEYRQRNLEIIQKRWPHVAEHLSSAPAVRAEIAHDGPQPTLLIDGIHLSSSYERQSEADLQASLIPQGSAEAWVYGIGLGDLPRALLRRRALRRLNVVVLNPSVAVQTFSLFPHADWLEDERVHLLVAAQQQAIRAPFAAVPSCLQLADNASSRLRDLVHLELATPFIRKRHSAESPEIKARLEENVPFLKTDKDVAELFGRFSGASVLVAGAGPTLSDHYERLLFRRSPLIAVDAALKPLIAAGIVPEFVVTIDGNEHSVSRFFQEADLSSCVMSSLIYFPTVHRRVLEMWPGPRFAALSDSPLFNGIRQCIPRSRLFSSGSVIHPAVDLGVKMGAAQITLLGADFGYPDNSSHVDGCVVAQPVTLGSEWVLGVQGQRIATMPNLRGYLRDLESYIAAQPQVDFFNGSSRGAHIAGTRIVESYHAF